MLKFVRGLYLVLNMAIIVALLAIHFVVKESSHQSSLLYYMLPLPIIIFTVLILSVFLSKRYRRYNLILTGLLLIIWLSRSFKINIPEDAQESDLEVVLWNASRENNFKEAFIENENIPDVFVLVEARRMNIKRLQIDFPEYHFYFSGEEISIFSKTPIEGIEVNQNKFRTIIVSFKVKDIRFYAVDGVGSLDVPRAWGLDFIDAQIEEKERAVLLGDFNVPFESKFFSAIKSNFNHAFNEKGNGFRETWFWNMPLLSLDHIWVSKDLQVIATKKINTFKSDHCMIRTTIRR
ncbi:endonuclease/exonuclease/phosphatase family protein [Algibacter amylolyticus]|uniref:Endonuclease/exonuclease/phosphatase family protein n=2 Tax=Algibacter amylolyticus TaxID=1608400 RepID=A0A5M7BD19_9FLAO|nr:endonuclease/exonuclease/phosphatase family protein [Algibacter amylolyticus]TSJ81801.1 endonuclease/exonuclease/phosphatase family protein [Algibacter amylolyticus]